MDCVKTDNYDKIFNFIGVWMFSKREQVFLNNRPENAHVHIIIKATLSHSLSLFALSHTAMQIYRVMASSLLFLILSLDENKWSRTSAISFALFDFLMILVSVSLRAELKCHFRKGNFKMFYLKMLCRRKLLVLLCDETANDLFWPKHSIEICSTKWR